MEWGEGGGKGGQERADHRRCPSGDMRERRGESDRK